MFSLGLGIWRSYFGQTKIDFCKTISGLTNELLGRSTSTFNWFGWAYKHVTIWTISLSNIKCVNAWVLLQGYAERYLPALTDKEGFFVFMDDMDACEIWVFRYRFELHCYLMLLSQEQRLTNMIGYHSHSCIFQITLDMWGWTWLFFASNI